MNEEDLVRSIEILLVEDNPGDIRLAREALRDSKLINRIYEVRDGLAALAFLRRQGSYADVVRPDLILLDLNLPKKNGREVLAEIKEDPRLKHIPVVVLTSSRAEEDVLRSYNLHANCYISKPVDLARFMEVVKSVENFWASIVTLPTK